MMRSEPIGNTYANVSRAWHYKETFKLKQDPRHRTSSKKSHRLCASYICAKYPIFQYDARNR